MKTEIKTFLEKALALAVSSLFIVAVVIYFQYKVVGNASFQVSPKKNVLVLGDSHTECALNDSILSNYTNISQSAEPYFYSFLKLKKFVAENPQIDTVLLGFNFMSLTKDFERRTVTNEFVYSRAQKYFPFFESEDLLNVFVSKPSFYVAVLNQTFFTRLVLHKKKLDFSFADLELGGYLNLFKFKLFEDIERSKVNLVSKHNFEYSSNQIAYLNKITEFCKEKNIKLLLLNTPIYSEAKKLCNTRAYYKYYSQNLRNIPLLDYSDEVLPDNYYADIEHLNFSGAKIFSERIKMNGLKAGSGGKFEEFEQTINTSLFADLRSK